MVISKKIHASLPRNECNLPETIIFFINNSQRKLVDPYDLCTVPREIIIDSPAWPIYRSNTKKEQTNRCSGWALACTHLSPIRSVGCSPLLEVTGCTPWLSWLGANLRWLSFIHSIQHTLALSWTTSSMAFLWRPFLRSVTFRAEVRSHDQLALDRQQCTSVPTRCRSWPHIISQLYS